MTSLAKRQLSDKEKAKMEQSDQPKRNRVPSRYRPWTGNLPIELLRRIEQIANRHHRTTVGEIIVAIEQYADQFPDVHAPPLSDDDLMVVSLRG